LLALVTALPDPLHLIVRYCGKSHANSVPTAFLLELQNRAGSSCACGGTATAESNARERHLIRLIEGYAH
jgi:hypothetical protein